MITQRDFIYSMLGITALALGSIANYENQELRREVAEVRTFCSTEDMQLLRLENQTRERVGLEIINYGVAKER